MRQKMLPLFLCCLGVLILLAGCSSSKRAEDREKKEEQNVQEHIDIRDSYVEKEMKLPKNVSVILDTCKTDEGKFRLVGTNVAGNKGTVWVLQEDGKAWELEDTFSSQPPNMEIVGAKISMNQQILFEVASGEKSEQANSFYRYQMKEKKTENLEVLSEIVEENKLRSLDNLDGDIILAKNFGGQPYIINLADETTTALLSNSEQMYSYEYSEHILYIFTENEIKAFDITQLKQVEINEESVFISDLSETKKMIDGISTMLANEMASLQKLIRMDEDTYIATVNTDSGSSLYQYAKRDKDDKQGNVLTIYTLYENKYLSQACAIYQRKHPKDRLKIEVGINDEAITVSEAVKALNVKIASGDTPDIFIMDGLNADNFVDENLLCDIKDVIDEVNNREGLFQNMCQVYTKGDETFAVPARFAEMIIASKEEKVFSSVDELVSYISGLAQADSGKLTIDAWNYGQFLSILYRYSIDDIVEESSVDEEKLIKLYESFQKLYQLNDMTVVAKDESKNMKHDRLIPYSSTGVDLVALGENQMALDFVNSIIGLALNKTAQDYADIYVGGLKVNNCIYAVPQTVVAISKTGSQQKKAKEVLKFLLSDTAQSSDVLNGFPVNREAYKKTLGELEKTTYILEGNDSSKELEFIPYTEEEIQNKLEEVEQINRFCNMDSLLKQIIMEQADNVLDGSTSVEEAAASAKSQIDLYINE